ncbi:MAG: KH domain-containing protein [Leptospiraceae bacterium]|nr:KH domain-containing protein [Leptospiraceae bacterium]MDW7975717.1 KH domain-containing protein [Leptospiraceae bacterium]
MRKINPNAVNLEPVKYLDYVIRGLVQHPEEVKIQKVEGTQETIIEIRVHPDDVGKIIGKNGSVIRAIRMIIQAVNNRDKKNYSVEIID